jgi:hypothetical protein
MWTVVPAIYNALTAPHIQNSIFVWTFLRCYCTYHDNSMLVVLQTWSQVQRTSSSLGQSELWPRPCTKYLLLRILSLQYSASGIIAAIVDITSIQCALYCKLGANYSAHPPFYAIWSVVPAIYKVFTAPDGQDTIFNWTYLRCNRRYSNTSMRVILQIWCQILRTSSGLRYVYCGPGHIECIHISAYSDFNIHLNVSARLL